MRCGDVVDLRQFLHHQVVGVLAGGRASSCRPVQLASLFTSSDIEIVKLFHRTDPSDITCVIGGISEGEITTISGNERLQMAPQIEAARRSAEQHRRRHGELVAEHGAQSIEHPARHGDLNRARRAPLLALRCRSRMHSSSMELSSVTTFSWPCSSSSGRISARPSACRAGFHQDHRILVDGRSFHQRFENRAQIADRNLFAQQLLQNLLHFAQSSSASGSARRPASGANRRGGR